MPKQKAEVTCTYLYADGHAVQVFEEDHPMAGRVQWVEIWQHYGPDVQFSTGRLVLGRYNGSMAKLIKGAWWVSAKAKQLDAGSENTRKMGIEVGYLNVGLSKHWNDHVTFYEMSCISGEYSYQPEVGEKFEDLDGKVYWADHKINKVHRVSEKQTEPGLVAA